jgi:hypothetical protein
VPDKTEFLVRDGEQVVAHLRRGIMRESSEQRCWAASSQVRTDSPHVQTN